MEIELKQAELRASRANKAAESIEKKICMVCGEKLVDRRGNWLTDDVMEAVLVAGGPGKIVAEDAHCLAHYDCLAGYFQSHDAVTA